MTNGLSRETHHHLLLILILILILFLNFLFLPFNRLETANFVFTIAKIVSFSIAAKKNAPKNADTE